MHRRDWRTVGVRPGYGDLEFPAGVPFVADVIARYDGRPMLKAVAGVVYLAVVGVGLHRSR